MAHHVRIPFEDLTRAYENGSRDKRYFLDIETGEIEAVFTEMIERGANVADAERIAAGVGTRYFLLPFKPSGSGYAEMEEFIGTIDDATARDSLTRAIEGEGAFRRFREILAIYPPEEDRWYEEKHERTDGVIQSWLDEHDIELEEMN